MIEYSRVRKIHFVGIGGSGMSGIAEVLHNMGFEISGSDIAENESIKRMKKMGIKVFLGHTAENVKGKETLVYSSAISRDNVEVKEAIKGKIPVIPRAEMLAELMRMKFSIAVAGTHGKTTTTSMIASILSTAQKDPTFVVGGKLKIEETGAKLGKSVYLIAEADESDGSFLQLFPTVAVITNIEDDHLDHYKTMDNLFDAFVRFGNKVPFYGSVILNYDCPNSQKIVGLLNKRVLTYGLDKKAEIRAERIKNSVFSIAYDLIIDGQNHGRVTLNIGGDHNVYNSLAAIAAGIEAGIEVPYIKAGLENFYLPDRRFQVLFYNDDYLVIDDYAHHPTEIKVTIGTLKKGNFNRIWAIFQPHRFTRLEILMERFVTSLVGVDEIIISKLYSANQPEISGISGEVLTQKIKESGFANVTYFDDHDRIVHWLNKNIKKGDAVLFLSAGSLTNTAHQFARALEEKRR